MLNKFLKDTAIYGVGYILSRAISLILVPIYTRVLSPTDYGIMDMIMMFSSMACLLVPLEISQAFSRFYSGSKSISDKRDYASNMLWFSLFMFVLFTVLALTFNSTLSRAITGSGGAETVFQLGIVATSLMGMFYVFQTQLRWQLKSVYYTSTSLLTAILISLLSALFVLGFQMGIAGLVWGMLLGYCAGILMIIPGVAKEYHAKIDKPKLYEMLKYSAPLLFMQVALLSTNYFDRLAIKNLMTVADVGLYGVAYRFASVIQIVFVGLQSSISPLILTHYHESRTPYEISRIFRLFSFIALNFLLTLGLFSREIIIWTTAEAYHSAWICIFPLALSMVFFAFDVFSPGIEIAKRVRARALITTAGAVLNIILNYILIPQWGIFGAASASATSAFIVLILHIKISQRHYPIPFDFKKVGAGLGLILFLSFAIQALSAGISVELFAAKIIILAICFFLLGRLIFDSNERTRIIQLAKSQLRL